MSLPKIDSPVFRATLPSNGIEVKFRPFTVKEEKLLLMASESNESKTTIDAVKQVMNNCLIDELDIDKIPTFDVEYLFIQLRSKSVDNMMALRFVEEEIEHEVEINLDDITISRNEEHDNKIHLNDSVSIIMKYPSFSMIEKMESTDQSDVVELISNSIDKIVNGEEVLELKDYTKEEINAFIESFTSKNMRTIEKFFDTMPKMKIDVPYKSKDGEMKSKEVVGIQSFFT